MSGVYGKMKGLLVDCMRLTSGSELLGTGLSCLCIYIYGRPFRILLNEVETGLEEFFVCNVGSG